MNLLEVRQQFRILSGRFDLVDNVGVDLGANFFINEGQKYLDRHPMNTNRRAVGRLFKILHAGDYYINFQQCRSIKEVWAATATGGRWQLTKKAIEDFRLTYTDMWGSLTQGSPEHYTPAFLRSVPETNHLPPGGLDAILGFADVMAGASYGYNGVLIGPPPDVDTHVEVWGLFYSDTLTADIDLSFWSVNYPSLLIMAALRSIEVFNRNTQGMKDWEAAIGMEFAGFDADVVEEEISEVDQMEG